MPWILYLPNLKIVIFQYLHIPSPGFCFLHLPNLAQHAQLGACHHIRTNIFHFIFFYSLLQVFSLHYNNFTGDKKDHRTLGKLRSERQSKIDGLKEKTNYYATLQLIQVMLSVYMILVLKLYCNCDSSFSNHI